MSTVTDAGSDPTIVSADDDGAVAAPVGESTEPPPPATDAADAAGLAAPLGETTGDGAAEAIGAVSADGPELSIQASPTTESGSSGSSLGILFLSLLGLGAAGLAFVAVLLRWPAQLAETLGLFGDRQAAHHGFDHPRSPSRRAPDGI